MRRDFFILLKKLVNEGVEFVIVGGFAGVVHGCTYVTEDLDICFDFSCVNLMRLKKALSALNPVHRMTTNRKKLELNEKNCRQFKNLYLDTDIGRLDCLSFISGIGQFDEVKKASCVIEAEGIRFMVLDIDGLIMSKKAMNRPRDKQAILQLDAIQKLKKKSGK